MHYVPRREAEKYRKPLGFILPKGALEYLTIPECNKLPGGPGGKQLASCLFGATARKCYPPLAFSVAPMGQKAKPDKKKLIVHATKAFRGLEGGVKKISLNFYLGYEQGHLIRNQK